MKYPNAAKKTVRWLFAKVIGYNRPLFDICRKYVEYYRGDFQMNPTQNGELRLINTVAPGSRMVFDVGAHVGDWTSRILQAHPEVEIHCFEPCHTTVGKLEQRYRDFANVTVNPLAVGSVRGRGTLHVKQDSSDMSSLYPVNEAMDKYHEEEACTIETIDDYCSERGVDHIDFLKVDVEGYEWEVFAGAREMIQSHRIRVIQFEYSFFAIFARRYFKDYFGLFDGLGYKLYKVFPEGLRPVIQYDTALENFNTCNYVAARAGAVDEIVVNRPVI